MILPATRTVYSFLGSNFVILSFRVVLRSLKLSCREIFNPGSSLSKKSEVFL